MWDQLSDQQLLEMITGSGADQWNKSFDYFSAQFLFDTVESSIGSSLTIS